nr:(deoxy)nucleoside triphosphate pyrophosphohydrolase [Maliibacterium massiliense]
MTRIAAAIIHQGGAVLICKRASGGACGGLWEFPGGKLAPGECAEDCAVRECTEELGVHIVLEKARVVVRHDYPEGAVEITFFDAHITQGTPQMRVHTDMRWVPGRALGDYAFCPANADVVRALVGEP